MKRLQLQILAVLMAAGFLAGVIHLFGIEFAGGDVYPDTPRCAAILKAPS